MSFRGCVRGGVPGRWTPSAGLSDNHAVTSSFEFPAHHPARPSDVERDKVLAQLRDGAVAGRLSHDTFVRRTELALLARSADELAILTADLSGGRGRVARLVFGTVEAVSSLPGQLRRAWRAGRLPKLVLPHAGGGYPGGAHPGGVRPGGAVPGGNPLRIGRDPANGLRLSHETVSRVHAELVQQGGVWVLRDLGSTNGTTVNGRRVIGAVVVRPGDLVGFGHMWFRLTAP
jgi:FHA domain/Domain of unknown function (DUF1707)